MNPASTFYPMGNNSQECDVPDYDIHNQEVAREPQHTNDGIQGRDGCRGVVRIVVSSSMVLDVTCSPVAGVFDLTCYGQVG